MKKVRKFSIIGIVSFFSLTPAAPLAAQRPAPSPASTAAHDPAQSPAAQPVRQVQLTQFNLQSSAIVGTDGAALSSPTWQPRDYWYPVTVPTTVLSGLVANKVYPDPYIGMNNMLIPDASDTFNLQYHLDQYSHLPGQPNPWKKPYWYRTTFSVPAGDKGRHFQLIFKGINYRADVWLNGQLMADSSRMVGMFEEFYLDADKAIRAGEENALAVKIYPLDEPGLPAEPQLKAMDDFFENGGPTGDIGKNVTMLCSVGWDWIPEVRDRNMGIWQPVYLRTTGQVVIAHPPDHHPVARYQRGQTDAGPRSQQLHHRHSKRPPDRDHQSREFQWRRHYFLQRFDSRIFPLLCHDHSLRPHRHVYRFSHQSPPFRRRYPIPHDTPPSPVVAKRLWQSRPLSYQAPFYRSGGCLRRYQLCLWHPHR